MLNELFVFNPIFLDLKRNPRLYVFFLQKPKRHPGRKSPPPTIRQTSPWDPGPEHWTRQNLVKDQFYSIRVPLSPKGWWFEPKKNPPRDGNLFRDMFFPPGIFDFRSFFLFFGVCVFVLYERKQCRNVLSGVVEPPHKEQLGHFNPTRENTAPVIST